MQVESLTKQSKCQRFTKTNIIVGRHSITVVERSSAYAGSPFLANWILCSNCDFLLLNRLTITTRIRWDRNLRRHRIDSVSYVLKSSRVNLGWLGFIWIGIFRLTSYLLEFFRIAFLFFSLIRSEWKSENRIQVSE